MQVVHVDHINRCLYTYPRAFVYNTNFGRKHQLCWGLLQKWGFKRLVMIEFDDQTYHSIALKILYLKSFDSKSIGISDRPENYFQNPTKLPTWNRGELKGLRK